MKEFPKDLKMNYYDHMAHHDSFKIKKTKHKRQQQKMKTTKKKEKEKEGQAEEQPQEKNITCTFYYFNEDFMLNN